MGRSHRSLSTFNAHDSNTICDVTGFKVKRSEVLRRWEGYYVTAEAWHPRQPQDFPVVPTPQRVVKDVRTEDLTTDAVQTFEII
jgi:hypothetical protein